MDFFAGFGFAADVCGFAEQFREKLKKSDTNWKEFISFINKIIVAVCKDYIRFVEESADKALEIESVFKKSQYKYQALIVKAQAAGFAGNIIALRSCVIAIEDLKYEDEHNSG